MINHLCKLNLDRSHPSSLAFQLQFWNFLFIDDLHFLNLPALKIQTVSCNGAIQFRRKRHHYELAVLTIRVLLLAQAFIEEK